MTTTPMLKVRLVATRYEAADIVSYVLAPLSGELPEVSAGAHVDVQLTPTLQRSYSLSDMKDAQGRYRLTVLKDGKSRGGSVHVHEKLHTGQVLEISHPKNHFPLQESSACSVFLAGGIGITPFLPMMKRLNALKKTWTLHYCARNRERAALIGEIDALVAEGFGRVIYNFDEEPGGVMLDINRLVGDLPADGHIYCCGPGGMLKAYQAATTQLDPDRVHFEAFSSDTPVAAEGGFTLVLAKSGREVIVQKGKTILDTVRDSGIDAPSSCEEGVCGACETRVISGVPDHRDSILGARERAANKTMMICCSGSKSDRLELDL